MPESNSKGTLIVIDGIDGSGKHTQAELLYSKLIEKYHKSIKDNIALVSFPNYGSNGCIMVEKYLNGDFGNDPNMIDPYTASLFYMIDRSISFWSDKWGEIYRSGGIVIADRYYTSNIIHQGAKILAMDSRIKNNLNPTLDNFREFTKFKNWLIDTEHNRIGVPKPNKIFWLITDKSSNEYMLNHRNTIDSSHKSDIHETNSEYLNYCRNAIQYYKNTVQCLPNSIDNFINVNSPDNSLKPIESIHFEILSALESILP